MIRLPFFALSLSFRVCLERDDVLSTFPQPILKPLHQHWATSTIATLTILFLLAYSVIPGFLESFARLERGIFAVRLIKVENFLSPKL
jgi:hypothetical protein